MSHFYTDSKDAKELSKMVGKDNPIASQIDKKEIQQGKYEVFEAITYLVRSAKTLYCEDELTWDETVSNLAEAIGKLKGKEKKLKAMADDNKNSEPMLSEGY